MPPSPGHIHQLPIKVLYSLDGASQSYLTVLGELQDVYIHPGQPGYAGDDEPGPVGSTLLKSLAQGVCYASPECTPSPSSLDFSVYALDPSPRLRPVQPFAPTTDEMAYTGKGFLSWALSEPANGKTLVKGRLVKEYDFDTSRFSHSEGGLEGLMRAGGGGDGRGWGLEVVLSLKMVNPAGKGEFSGRMEFERMLYNPSPAGVGASGSVLINNNNNTNTNPNANTHPRSTASTSNTNSPRIARANILPPPPPTRPIATSSPAHRASSTGPMHGPAPGNKVNANGGPAAHRIVRPPPQSSSSRSSLPPSSMPMAPSSSQSQSQAQDPGQGRGPSRPSSTSTVVDDPGRTPTGNTNPQVNGVGVGIGKPPSAGPSKPAPQNTTPPKSAQKPVSTTSTQSRNRNREVTPPPLPRPRSPPPTTPHRRALRDLLQADGKMSPSLAKDLVNNPSLLALLKSIPTTKNDTGANANGNGNGNGSDTKGKGKGNEVKPDLNPGSSRSARDGTPTPTAPKAKVESIPGGCFNCGTMETSLWRVKSYPDGTKKKVCDACGLYFNKHKSMRPKELWEPHLQNSSARDATGPGQGTKRPHSHLNPTPPPVRHSPRLSRQPASSDSHTHPPLVPHPPESPSKRRRVSNKPIPQPSPRMATRSTARSDVGVGGGGGMGRMDPFPFSSPGSGHGSGFGFGTSPAVPLDQSHSMSGHSRSNTNTNTNPDQNTNTNTNTHGMDDMDIDALLAQLTNGGHAGNDHGDDGGGGGMGMDLGLNLPPGINLEELFATVDNAAQTDDALAEDMMKFLAGLENDDNLNQGHGQDEQHGQGDGQGGGPNG